MEMSEGGKVSVLVLGKETCRVLQGGNAPSWSLVFVPKVNKIPSSLPDFSRGVSPRSWEQSGLFQLECAPLEHYLPWCLLLFFMLKNNEIHTSAWVSSYCLLMFSLQNVHTLSAFCYASPLWVDRPVTTSQSSSTDTLEGTRIQMGWWTQQSRWNMLWEVMVRKA